MQQSDSDMFLNSLLRRKRGVVSKRTVVRKYGRTVAFLSVLLLVCGCALYAYSYVEKRGLLKIKNVEVIGASNFVSYNDILKMSESNLLGKKYFSVDLPKTATLLKGNFLGAKNIHVQRSSVGKVRVVVEERVPLAIIFSETDSKSFLIDGDGYILGEVESNPNNYPVVRYDKSIKIGSFVEKDVAPITIEILKFSEKDDLKISSISYHPKYVEMYVYNGVTVLIGNTKNKENSISVVSSLLKKFDVGGKKITKIDLRFDKVIVSYE